ncbi:hypothetical protein A6F57_19780 [Alteromonas stellipolaris]|uniref:phage portal protein n=1 Tax=Alteromonas stellipolaris TaxID=233316 RepID=UPI0007B4331B|nr:phage portal protein [Alteromonas stellipolaris]ANB27221.1 hypothetical protein A6F57_19780 [Alteromonas stellipolaris]
MFSFLRKTPTKSPSEEPVRKEPVIDATALGGNTNARDAKRHKAYAQQRFAAASSPRIKSNGFFSAGLSVDETLRRDLMRLKAASRAAGEDVGYMKRYFSMVQTHVIGDKGPRLHAEVRDKRGELDKIANQSIEKGFMQWAKLGVCEISGRMDLVAAAQLIAKTVCQDGDIIIRHIDGAPNKFGYAFQLLEADLLDVTLNKDLGNGNRIKMGVEIDKWGRHTAYHLLTNHPGEFTWSSNGKRYMRLTADEVTLPFPMFRPGQTRGVPWAHASLLDFHDIGGYRESSLVASRIAASNMVMYERDPEQEAPEDEEEGDFIFELDPGGAAITPEGYRAKETNFQHHGDSVADFQKAGLKGAFAGVDVNYSTGGNDYEGVSWSSLRQAVLEDREHWKRHQGWFISQVMSVIYKRWLKNALLHGGIENLMPFDLERSVEAFSFKGRRWQWVDPLKDEQAIGAAMENFTCNPMDILNEKGVDIDAMAEGWGTYLSALGPVMEIASKLGIGKAAKLAVATAKAAPSEKGDDDETE